VKRQPKKSVPAKTAVTVRQPTETMLVLLRTFDRLNAKQLDEADRQLIRTLLSGIIHDKDVRDYFWETIRRAPTKANLATLKSLSMSLGAIAEAMGDKRAFRQKVLSAKTGLTRDQVSDAKKEYQAAARARIAKCDPNTLASWNLVAEAQVETLRKKLREK
jgi:hypothetical protein